MKRNSEALITFNFSKGANWPGELVITWSNFDQSGFMKFENKNSFWSLSL